MKKRNFDDILNECIERMLEGESVESCLASYPEHASALAPLLRTTLDTLRVSEIKPRPEFRQQAGLQFQTAILNLKPAKEGFFRWQARWVTVVSALVVILLAGGGTVAASTSALPDSPLYTVKLATENVRLALTMSDLGKAELYAEFADKRVDEIIKMAEKGDVAMVEKATDRMSSQLVALASLPLPATYNGKAVEDSQALMAAPAPQAAGDGPPEAGLGETSATEPPLRAMAAPVTEDTDNLTRASLSASSNATAIRAPEKAEAQPELAPLTATARSLTPVSANKTARTRVKKPEDLQIVVSEQAAENAQKLEDVLQRVPDSVKTAVERAITVADDGYDEVLENIGR